ncbi:MAG: hypothetical protein R2911_44735 [Caldilineaceae bacterium]
MALVVLAACGPEGANVPPTEEEQIKNVAASYFVRNQSLPEYEVQIEEVVDEWARVSLAPAPAAYDCGCQHEVTLNRYSQASA